MMGAMAAATTMGFTLSPAFGWVVSGILALAMALFAIACIVTHVRRRGTSDETVIACARRTLICLLVGIIMLTPSVTTTTTSRAVTATDVMIAVDITGSMAVNDAQYGSDHVESRLDAAKQAVKDITARYADSSFAAMRFGASGTLDVPLTPDSIAIDGWADTLTTEATSVSAGSNLDAPLDQLMLSLKSIRNQHPDDTILLYLITDGEQTSTAMRRSYSTLRRYLDDAFTIGIGSEAGGKIPMIADGLSGDASSSGTGGAGASNNTGNTSSSEATGPHSAADNDGSQWVIDPTTGQPGISKLGTSNLLDIADEMGGSYVPMDATHTIANALSSKASTQWKLTTTSKRRSRAEPVVWPFAIALIVLMTWEMGAWIITSRRLL